MAKYDLGTINITLDPESIKEAIFKIRMINAGLNRAAKAMYNYLLDEGVKVTRMEIVRLCNADKMSGDLWLSVKSSPEFMFDESTGIGKAYITAGEGLKSGKDGMSYAVYVEYGTGVHAESRKKQETAQGATSLWGPKLKLPAKKPAPETKAESVKPMHFQDKDGKWYTTYGQPPKPFMRNAKYKLMSNAQKKWSELLNQYLPRDMG